MSEPKTASLALRLAGISVGILGLELAAWMATIFAASFTQRDFPLLTAYLAGATFYGTVTLAPIGFLLGAAVFLFLGDEQTEAIRKRAMIGMVLHPIVFGFGLYFGLR